MMRVLFLAATTATATAVVGALMLVVFLSVSDPTNSSSPSSNTLHRRLRRHAANNNNGNFADPKTVEPRTIDDAVLGPLVHSSQSINILGADTIIQSTQQQSYHECINHVESITLPSLIEKLAQDPENNGLIPHNLGLMDDGTTGTTTPTTTTPTIMKGLDFSTFRGKRIAMVGDSTLFYPTKWLYAAMKRLNDDGAEEGSDNPFLIEYDKMTMSEGSSVVRERATHSGQGLGSGGHPLPIVDSDGTRIEWTGMAGTSTWRREKRLEGMLESAENMKPDIVVANMGLHWLHLCGFRNCPSTEAGNDLRIMKHWINYKQDWLQRIYDAAQRGGAKLLLFKTTNFICDAVRTNDWAMFSELYTSFDEGTIGRCVRSHLELTEKEEGIPSEEVVRYCTYGQFTNVGSEYLNEMIRDFVRELHNSDEEAGSTIGGLTVGIFEDASVQGCYSTRDALHHHGAEMVRLRLLANTIETYSGCLAQ